MPYSVGDCIGIYPTNNPHDVSTVLNLCQATGDEIVTDKEGNAHTSAFFLSHKTNLDLVNKKLQTLFEIDPTRQYSLFELLKSKQVGILNLIDNLSPLMPRFYSIASSQKAVGGEIHLTVAVTEYEFEGEKKLGTCSDFLCHRAPLEVPVIPIYHHPAREFTLSPESFSKPIIMIGPGTGIAPFRGFMQERVLHGCQQNWLFFGERYQKLDFYYEAYWKELTDKGFLRLDTAFSRDQEQKLYVQHKMLEHSKDFWNWLLQGAYLFVCGDATRMAKDVEATLLKIIETEGNLSPPDARNFVKNLRKEKKYLRDVY